MTDDPAHALAQAVLLFHSAEPWTAETRVRWTTLTGYEMASARSLCDFARSFLGQVAAAENVYRDENYAERRCDHCGRLYRGPSVYCRIECALGAA